MNAKQDYLFFLSFSLFFFCSVFFLWWGHMFLNKGGSPLPVPQIPQFHKQNMCAFCLYYYSKETMDPIKNCNMVTTSDEPHQALLVGYSKTKRVQEKHLLSLKSHCYCIEKATWQIKVGRKLKRYWWSDSHIFRIHFEFMRFMKLWFPLSPLFG